MRLWSLHPRYLDRQGLLALWREGLLARKVLAGLTRGYRDHPQLLRFREVPDPVAALERYLSAVTVEAEERGYRFDANKIERLPPAPVMHVTAGQLAYEWAHLRRKLSVRSPDRLPQFDKAPLAHPCLEPQPGPIADWERLHWVRFRNPDPT